MRLRTTFGPATALCTVLALAACSGGATVGSGGSVPAGGSGAGGSATASPAAGSTATPASNATASPAPGITPTPAPNPSASGGTTTTTAPTPVGTEFGADQPADATSSEQTYGLTCSPAFVVSSGGYSSCNMKWIEHINLNGGETIGGKWVAANNTFYLDNWETGVYAFDTTNPTAPVLDSSLSLSLGTLATPALISSVENEETATNGKVLILSSTALNEAVVLDVSNPKAMKEIATVPSGPGHTQTCLDDCAWDYGSTPNVNENGGILTQPTIIDLANPSAPVLSAKSWDAVINPSIYYHNVTEIHPGLVATASNPVYFLDTTDPANPTPMFNLPMSPAEPEPAAQGPSQSGHLGHSVQWPNQGQDQFFLGQSEGAYVGRCEEFPADGRTLYSYDTTGWQTTHNFRLAGAYTLQMGDADQGSNGGVQLVDSNGSPSTVAVGTPEGCSTHWFDINSTFKNGGLLAMASFSFGVRLLNVTSSGQIEQVGWWVPSGVSDTVGVYWVGPRTLYALDFETGGLDVIEYTGPLPASGPLTTSIRKAAR